MVDRAVCRAWRRVGLLVGLAWIFAGAPLVAAGDQQPRPPASDAPPTGAPAEQAEDQKPETRSSPWLLAPLVSSSPKLGTSFGALGAYLHRFDPDSQVSLFGLNYQYTSTHSTIAAAFARASFHADHQRIVVLGVFGYIKNNYDDYLGTGQPLKTNDDLKAVSGRYLYRVKGDWFIGAQGSASNYQVLGDSTQDDLVLETLGVKGFKSAAIGAVAMHDSRDNPDMPTAGWYLNVNNLAYREGLGGDSTFDAYRVDTRAFWPHGKGHVLAFRQYNWLTHDAPSAAQATVMLRGYKFGEFLAPYMSSLEAEERLSFGKRWGATLFAGVASLYGESATASTGRDFYPAWGGGIHFVVKPAQRMLINLEYAAGVEDNRGVYLKFGYGW
jgi:hypothetical protein